MPESPARPSFLPEYFCTNLNVPRTAGTDHRIRSGNVWRVHHCAHGRRRAQVRVHRKDVEIGSIGEVEELAAQLKLDSLMKVPHLGDRCIEVPERGPAENVAAHRALGPVRRRSDDGIAGDETSSSDPVRPTHQLISSSL